MILGVQSPTWLAAAGREDEADKSDREKLGDEYCVIAENKKEQNEKVSVMELFSPKYRKNTLVGGIFYACPGISFGVGIFLPILTPS